MKLDLYIEVPSSDVIRYSQLLRIHVIGFSVDCQDSAIVRL